MAVLSKRKGETQEQRRAAELVFVEATLALLAEGSSYADLGVEKISSRAGRTRTAFYFYFRDKRDLLMRATEEVGVQLFAEADRWWSGDAGREGLRTALSSILATYHANGPLLRAIVEASTYDDQVGEFWRGLLGRFIDSTEDHLLGLGADDPEAAHAKAFALVWMTERAAYQHVVRGGRLDDRALVEALVEIWDRAVYG